MRLSMPDPAGSCKLFVIVSDGDSHIKPGLRLDPPMGNGHLCSSIAVNDVAFTESHEDLSPKASS